MKKPLIFLIFTNLIALLQSCHLLCFFEQDDPLYELPAFNSLEVSEDQEKEVMFRWRFGE
jgi:hypothetical protein